MFSYLLLCIGRLVLQLWWTTVQVTSVAFVSIHNYKTFFILLLYFFSLIYYFYKHTDILTFFLRQCQSVYSSVQRLSYEFKYLGQAARRMEDFLSVSWVSDPNVSEILVLHHVTSLHVQKRKRHTQINTFTHRHTHSHTHTHMQTHKHIQASTYTCIDNTQYRHTIVQHT